MTKKECGTFVTEELFKQQKIKNKKCLAAKPARHFQPY